MDEGHFLEAAEAFQNVTRMEPENAAAWCSLGVALGEQEKWAQAEAALRNCLDIDPRHSLASYKLGVSLYMRGNIKEAEQAFRRATDIDPHYSQAWNNLGFALANQGKHTESCEVYRCALDIDPHYVQAWRNLGFSLWRDGQHRQSSEAYRRALDIVPQDSGTWCDLGRTFGTEGKHQEAEEAFRQAISIDPGSAAAWEGAGVALANQEKPSEAETLFRKALELESNNAHIWTNLGNLLLDQRKYEEGEQAFRKAVDIDPEYARGWNDLGAGLKRCGNIVESQNAYRRAIGIDPHHTLAWRNLIKSLLDQNDNIDAESACLRYVAINPQDAQGWCNLGLATWRQYKYDEAIQAYRRATDLDPSYIDAWFAIGSIRLTQGELHEAEQATRRAIRLGPNSNIGHMVWHNIASVLVNQNRDPMEVLYAHNKMARAIEDFRLEQPGWQIRLREFSFPASSLTEAAEFYLGSIPGYEEVALRFAVQSKARTLNELLSHEPDQLRGLLDREELETLDSIERDSRALEMELHGWSHSPEIEYRATGSATEQLRTSESPEQGEKGHAGKDELTRRYDAFFRRVALDHPELEPFITGPRPRHSTFSLRKLQRRLKPREAVLELLLTDKQALLCFLVTEHGLVYSGRWETGERPKGLNGPTLQDWREEIASILHIGQDSRAEKIKSGLTQETLCRWGEVLYGPFIDNLQGIDRLWIGPHSFLAQLPFNGIPFPDGVARETAVIPSAASLLRPSTSIRRPKPRFTLGVVAADAVPHSPLDLQREEVRLLSGLVSSSTRRWELAGDRPYEEPTLANIQERVGLTRCLVLSCHGDSTGGDWGSLALGTRDNPELVTGRRLVDSLLLGGLKRNMEVDLVVTSACLTGQIDLDKAEEWLGLPMALQSVWRTKAMLLTLWEVEELPAMLWVTEFVRALMEGSTAGRAQTQAQEKVRGITREQTEVSLLADARAHLPEERWQRVDRWWRETSRTSAGGQHPFSHPVHWAPYILIGDPRVTISPRRASANKNTQPKG